MSNLETQIKKTTQLLGKEKKGWIVMIVGNIQIYMNA
jgi:hypothetical protein